MRTQWERMWDSPDSREVGLEAATLQRVRNSSPVEGTRAEDVTGLSPPPKPRIPRDKGQGARDKQPATNSIFLSLASLLLPLGVVGERPPGGEAGRGLPVEAGGVRIPE